MNPKTHLAVRTSLHAATLLALLLPLAGCGNKGPLMLQQSAPPVEADVLPSMPPMDEMMQPTPPASTEPALDEPVPAADTEAEADNPASRPPAADGNG